MPLFTKEGLSVLFLHIPKSGGTSVNAAFQNQGFRAHYLQDKIDQWHTGRTISPQHYHFDIIRQIIDISQISFCFALIRDPLSRLVSEFKHQRSAGIAKDDNFVEWYDRIKKIKETNPSCFDNHLRPQVDFVHSSINLYAFPGMLSELQADFMRISNLSLSFPVLNTRSTDKQASLVSLAKQTTAESDYSEDIALYNYLVSSRECSR
jgi:hypothetical protein